MSRWAYSH